jgi:MFS family permease
MLSAGYHGGVSATPGALAPLRHPVFRALWTAVLAANVGIWMQSVAAAWEMTSLSRSTTMVALVQAATSLPVVVCALPAGALADIVDRRKLLLGCQLWVAVVATLLSGLTFAGWMTPGLLLAFTFLLGLGVAMWAPAWMATMPDLVPRAALPSAVALGGVSINTARAVGPAVGGTLLAVAGAGAVFLANAVLAIAAGIAFARFTPARLRSGLPSEHILSALVAGGRYVRFSPELRRALWRTGLFMFGGSAAWALLPVVARGPLGLGSSGYGLLLACLGIGALAVVPALAVLRERLPAELLSGVSGLAFAAATLALALELPIVATCVLLAVGGAGWTASMALFSTSTQQVLPAWVRARALAYYLLIVQGGLAAGSALWGWLAEATTLRTALLASIAVLVCSAAAGGLRPLQKLRAEPLPSLPWPEPLVAIDLDPDDGPVLISIAYDVPPGDAEEFLRLARGIERIRRRDGAVSWRLYRDVAEPEAYAEIFETRTWDEHVRQHARFTLADRPLEDAMAQWRVERDESAARHLVAVVP